MKAKDNRYIRIETRRFKQAMLTTALIGSVVVAGIGIHCYNLGYSKADEIYSETLENTVESLSMHYDGFLEEKDAEIAELRSINMQLRIQTEAIPVIKPEESTNKSLNFNSTAYTLRVEECGKSEDDPAYGITASGNFVEEWYTVAAPKSIPFGTKLYIPFFKDKPNKGIFVVQDRGGAIKEGHLDIYMASLEEALEFGRRDLEVYIID